MRRIDELTGAKGRRVHYRAERHRAEAIFSRVAPSVQVDDRDVLLHDMSMSGVSVHARDTDGWGEPGEAEVWLRISLHDRSVYDGPARLCRIEPSPRGVKAGLQLKAGYLDIQNIADRQRSLALWQDFDEGLPAATNMVDPNYRRLCADLINLLRHCRNVLDHGSARPMNGTGAAPKANGKAHGGGEDMLEACIRRVMPVWEDLWYRANDLVTPTLADRDVMLATKRFTETVVTPEFMPGPIWWRGYHKPLNYPGDFELMRQVYAGDYRGATPYGKLMHRLGLEVAECIATRMEMMLQTITATVGVNPGGPPARVMSLGCGPGEEVYRYLQIDALPRPVHFTLIDQEERALARAYENIFPLTIKHGGGASLSCLHASFMQMMKAGELFGEMPPQDLIYAVGLVDYLGDRRARDLVTALFAQLAPGGLLVIGNMKATRIGNLWPLEFLCDWNLVYRSEADMRALAAGLDPAAIQVDEDPTGRVYLISLRAR